MNSREDFEAWARNRFGRGMVIQASNGPYVWDSVQDAWGVWQAAAERAAKLCEAHKVPVGNSAAGEMACEWTVDALREVADAIRS